MIESKLMRPPLINEIEIDKIGKILIDNVYLFID